MNDMIDYNVISFVSYRIYHIIFCFFNSKRFSSILFRNQKSGLNKF